MKNFEPRGMAMRLLNALGVCFVIFFMPGVVLICVERLAPLLIVLGVTVVVCRILMRRR